VDLAREGRRNSLPGTAKLMATPYYRVDYAPRNVLLSHGEAKLSLESQVKGDWLGITEHLIKAIGLLSF